MRPEFCYACGARHVKGQHVPWHAVKMLEAKSITDLAALVGRRGRARVGAFHVDVRVLDVKQAYGETRYLVEPIAGEGVAWVTGATFTLSDMKNV